MNASALVARALVDELVRCGVREAVLAPGSRSAPLALALHAAAEATAVAQADAGTGRLRLHVRVDERSAGFLAVGLARTGRAPVAVLTTSGTAVANLHPAVLEASHAGLPLLVLTADRPARLRGTRANQTTDQVDIFGSAVRLSADLPGPTDTASASGASGVEDAQLRGVRPLVARCVAAALGARTGDPGPVQLNLQLDDPLVPDGDEGELPQSLAGRPEGAPWTTVTPVADPGSREAEPMDAGVPTVVVAGDDAGPPARLLAETAGWPLLAEPTSGARTGSHALRCYRLLLDGALAEGIRRVVVCGHPTLSRPVVRLVSRADVEVVVVSPGGATWTDPGHAVSRVVPAARAYGEAEPGWLDAWQRADKAVGAAVDLALDAGPTGPAAGGLGPHQVARAVAAALPPEGLLVVGSSNPVRDLDLMAPPYPVGERRKIIGNRGLAGIDGMVSTAVGAALARRSSRALAYLGDLTFLHDSNGLLLGPQEPRPDLTFVVANDDGGSIFATLEQGGEEHADAFERVFGTPHGADLSALCAASGTPYRRCDSLDDLAAALARPGRGIEVIEVPVDRTDRRGLDQRLRDAARNTLDALDRRSN
ncbi:MAG TPA: 2-succinyl-5-enolpyruvyl-6-hydroxy-3-cyclohexene-1-carboxylic-acid synthase [Nocardioidaceae bacterium]|nr:2-succinyl-5-enolpyruvyl-6-hydroxy-3-cyclohexene-1-carboxylic-acid synthase [Nocardioidaceae bacterium]